MTIEEVVAWFGNLNRACKAINIASQNMTKWKKQGYIPLKQQFKIAVATEGDLMPDEEDPYPGRPKKFRPTTRKSNETEVENSSSSRISCSSDSV